MKKFFYVLMIISAVFFVFGCREPGVIDDVEDDQDSQDEQEPESDESEYYAVIPETTKQADDATESALLSVSADNSTLTFDDTSDQLAGLKAGDVLVLGESALTPAGLLRKVVSIDDSGSDIVVTTEQATLEDAVEEAHVGFTETLDSGAITPKELSPGVRVIAAPKTITPRALNLDLENREILPGVSVTGEISFDMDLEFVLDIDYFTLERCDFIIHMDYESDLQFDITTDTDIDEVMIEVGTLSFPPIIVPAGIELIFFPELSLNVGIDGNVTAGITSRVVQTAELDAGLEYDEEWSKVKDFTSNFQFDTPQMEAEVGMKGLIGPELSIKLYDIVGPYVNAYGYLKLDAAMVDSEPWWELHGGLELAAGVEIEVFSENATIADTGRKEIIQYDRLLATGTGTQNHNWTLQTIDQFPTDEDHVYYTSDIVVDSSGDIHIAYGYDCGEYYNEQLKYAHYDGYVWTVELVDEFPKRRPHPGIAIGSDGTVYIAYSCDPGDSQLALATRTGSGWSIETIDTDGPRDEQWSKASLVLDESDNPHVAYAAYTGLGSDALIRYVYREGAVWHSEIVNPAGADEGSCSSPDLELGSDGRPRIVFRERDLWYGYKDDTGWHLESFGMSNIINCRVALDLDCNDKPHIAYYDGNFGANNIRYRYNTSGSWADELVSDADYMTGNISFALDAFDTPHFVYHEYENDTLWHAEWQGAGYAVGAVDETSPDTGRHNTIFIDGGTSYVTYYDAENERLRLAVWSGD